MRSGMIDMESNTTLVQCYPAHEAVPDGQGPFPAVIVAHDRFGMTSSIRAVANRLANSGFYSLAPCFYGMPTSVADVAPEFMRPTLAVHYGSDDGAGADDAASTLSDERASAIFQQAIAYAIGRGKVRAPRGVGVLGFAMGGRLAFLAACRNAQDVAACVSFYPKGIAGFSSQPGAGGSPLDLAGELRASLLLFYGELDTTIARREREAIRDRLTALGKDFRIEVFHDAGRDFFSDDLDTRRIHASKVAWDETLALFRRCL
jgi:carboxymethylenebutenolidase